MKTNFKRLADAKDYCRTDLLQHFLQVLLTWACDPPWWDRNVSVFVTSPARSSARQSEGLSALRVNFTMISRTEYLNHHRPNWVAHVQSLHMLFVDWLIRNGTYRNSCSSGHRPTTWKQKTATWAARYLTWLILMQPLPNNEGILKPFTEDLFKPVRSGGNHMVSALKKQLQDFQRL